MECSTSRISFTATVHVRRTTCKSVPYSSFVRHIGISAMTSHKPTSTGLILPSKPDTSWGTNQRYCATGFAICGRIGSSALHNCSHSRPVIVRWLYSHVGGSVSLRRPVDSFRVTDPFTSVRRCFLLCFKIIATDIHDLFKVGRIVSLKPRSHLALERIHEIS